MRSSKPRHDGAISEEMLNVAWEIVHARSAGGPRSAHGTGTSGTGRSGSGTNRDSHSEHRSEGRTSNNRKIRTGA